MHEARQDRARQTGARLVEVTRALLRDQDLDALSVAAIAGEAGVSVGGFYARFKNKDALLHALDAHLLDEMYAAVRRAMDPARLQGLDARAVVDAYLRTMLRMFGDNRSLVRQVALKARSSKDPGYHERAQAFNREAHSLLCARLLERGVAAGHPDPGQAIQFATLMVSATAREAVLFGDRRLNLSSPRGKRLREQLLHGFLAYLQTDPEVPS